MTLDPATHARVPKAASERGSPTANQGGLRSSEGGGGGGGQEKHPNDLQTRQLRRRRCPKWRRGWLQVDHGEEKIETDLERCTEPPAPKKEAM